MIYTICDDCILINNFEDFNIKHILECGQVFRYKVRDFGYTIYSMGQKADVYCQKGNVKIFCKDTKYFVNYFDLDTNYDKIKLDLIKIGNLKDEISYGKGIRILKQNPLEMIISFIISANNNIPRIKLIIERICEKFGDNKGEYYSFPTLEQ